MALKKNKKTKSEDLPDFGEDILDEDEELYEEVDLEDKKAVKAALKRNEQESKAKKDLAGQVPNQRFAAFETPKKIGIADVETGEIIAEGDFAVLQMLAKMLSNQEKILDALGNYN